MEKLRVMWRAIPSMTQRPTKYFKYDAKHPNISHSLSPIVDCSLTQPQPIAECPIFDKQFQIPQIEQDLIHPHR